MAPSRSAHLSRAAVVGLLLLAIAGAMFGYFFYQQRHLHIDDAYITYRFGQRLAERGTLRWNLGENDPRTNLPGETLRLLERPVEGYTSFLAVLLSAVFIKIGQDPLSTWKALGIVLALLGGAAIVWGGRGWLRSQNAPARLIALMPLLLAGLHLAYPLTALHAASGMETLLYTTLLLWLSALALRISGEPEKTLYFKMFGFAGLGLGMTRPDGVLWFLVASIGLFFALPRKEKWFSAPRRKLMRWLTFGFIVPGAVYFLWRLWYFRSLLPATFHAKSAGPERPSPLGRLFTYFPSHWELWQYVRDQWLILLLFSGLCVGLWMLYRRRNRTTASDKPLRPWTAALGLAAASAACLLFFARTYLLMGFGWRFFYPFGQTLLLCILLPAALAIARLRPVRRLYIALCTAAPLVLIWTVCLTAHHVVGTFWGHSMMPSPKPHERHYKIIGQAFQSAAETAGRPLLVYHHNVGELFYYAPDTNTVDPVGLVDLPVALHGFSADYVVNRRPDILLLPSKKQRFVTEYNYVFGIARIEIFPDISQCVARHPVVQSDYEDLGVSAWNQGAVFHLFVRRDLLEAHEEIEALLRDKLHLEPTGDAILKYRIHPPA